MSKLIASNDSKIVRKATDDAFSFHDISPTSITLTIGKLTGPLKGVGPATASLILSIYDPDRVTFFSDEVYRWLCADGNEATMKYDTKEYAAVYREAYGLIARLEVTALDIEKVAYVLVKGGATEISKTLTSKTPTGRPNAKVHKSDDKKTPKAQETRERATRAERALKRELRETERNGAETKDPPAKKVKH